LVGAKAKKNGALQSAFLKEHFVDTVSEVFFKKIKNIEVV
jgi:hypothetical protein